MTLTQNYKFVKFSPKTEMCSIFMKFGTWSKSNMLIMNIVLGIDVDPKLKIRANLVSKLKCVSIFMKFGTQDIFNFFLMTPRISLRD